MRVSDSERIKLTASLFNSIASGTFIASVVAPFAGIAFGTIHPVTDPLNLVGASAFLFVLAIVVHLIARRMLLRIEEAE